MLSARSVAWVLVASWVATSAWISLRPQRRPGRRRPWVNALALECRFFAPCPSVADIEVLRRRCEHGGTAGWLQLWRAPDPWYRFAFYPDRRASRVVHRLASNALRAQSPRSQGAEQYEAILDLVMSFNVVDELHCGSAPQLAILVIESRRVEPRVIRVGILYSTGARILFTTHRHD